MGRSTHSLDPAVGQNRSPRPGRQNGLARILREDRKHFL